MEKYVLDTNILMSLEKFENLIKFCKGKITIPIYVIEELDHLKGKEGSAGFQARRALRNLEKIKDNIDYSMPCKFYSLPSEWDPLKMDNKIINVARNLSFDYETILLSNDLNVRIKCEILGVETQPYFEQKEITYGWTEIHLNSQDYLEFSEEKENKWNVPLNEYLIIKDDTTKNEIYGVFKFLGDNDWIEVFPEKLGNGYIGTITPKDEYQQCAINSLLEDDFTVITGKAGSGKTLLSLTYALRQIQSEARNKLIIFANPVKTRGADELGFYKGDRTDKLLQNSIGAMLSSKLGGLDILETLIAEGKVEILPISDIRGYEAGPKNIMYITEAQNLSTDLMKLAIQRCAEGTKIILEGDPYTQVDHYSFEGANNGLSRVIEIFNGYYGFAHINLPIIYRSRIANKAEEM